MEIRLRKPQNTGDWLRLYGLYRSAFPAAERKPFGVIVSMYRNGRTDLWCIYREGKFAGLAATVNGDDLVLLDYFAVHASCRGQGIGSGAMKRLTEHYHDRGLYVEIESTRENAPDREIRLKRKHFYQDAGLRELDVTAQVFGVEMELLGIRCALDFEGYQRFYREHYSPWAAEHIRKSES